jgi:hypothetical protein
MTVCLLQCPFLLFCCWFDRSLRPLRRNVGDRAIPWYAGFLYHGSDPACDIPPTAPLPAQPPPYILESHLPQFPKHTGACDQCPTWIHLTLHSALVSTVLKTWISTHCLRNHRATQLLRDLNVEPCSSLPGHPPRNQRVLARVFDNQAPTARLVWAADSSAGLTW